MRALWKRITEPPFGSILSSTIHLSLGIGLCVVAQTVLVVIGRIESSSGHRFELPTRIEQYNWDFYAGHPWLGLLIGICTGIALNRIDRADLGVFNRQVDTMVLRAQGMKPKPPPFRWKSHLALLLFILLFSMSVLTYLLHISSSAFFLGMVASNNASIYGFRRRVYAEATSRLVAMELDRNKREVVTRWSRRNHRKAVTDFCLALVVVAVIIVGTTTYSRNWWLRFRSAEASAAAKQSHNATTATKEESGEIPDVQGVRDATRLP